MPEILALLQDIAPLLEKTTFNQMSRIVLAMLASSGRITRINNFCPQHYDATINLSGDPRYWYGGTGGQICSANMFSYY
jgi:hypothetical protein